MSETVLLRPPIYDTNRCIAVFSGNSGSVRNVKIKNVTSRSRVYAGWWGKGEPFVVTNAGTTGKIANVSISGITAESDSPALIIGDGIENAEVENYHYTAVNSHHPELLEKAELLPNGLFEKADCVNGLVRCAAKKAE